MSSLRNPFKHPYTPYFIIITFFLVHLFFSWPGTMTPDSDAQYHMAIAGLYNDHHPPMMSFLWSYLNKIYPGPGLLLFFHLSLLYAAITLFISTFKNYHIKLFYLAFPFIPSLLVYSWMIWKDVGFAFSYLFLAALLTRLTFLNKPLTWPYAFIVFSILFYGTAVKFQAQYCAPIVLLWIACLYHNYKLNLITFASALLLNVLFFILLNSFNSTLVPQSARSHSWQFVKLYDLAAISYETNQPLFPKFVQNSNFNMEILKKKFNSQRIDDLAFSHDAILKIGQNPYERQLLWSFWLKTILKYPFIYFKHRLKNLAYSLLSVPGLLRITGSSVFWKSDPASSLTPANAWQSLLVTFLKILATILLAPLPIIFFCLFYIILAFMALPYDKAAIPLLFMMLASLNVLMILFFFSMAGNPRYVYLATCLTHASHPLAYLSWKALAQRNKFRLMLSNP